MNTINSTSPSGEDAANGAIGEREMSLPEAGMALATALEDELNNQCPDAVVLTQEEFDALTKERFGNMHKSFAEGFRRLMRAAIEANADKARAALTAEKVASQEQIYQYQDVDRGYWYDVDKESYERIKGDRTFVRIVYAAPCEATLATLTEQKITDAVTKWFPDRAYQAPCFARALLPAEKVTQAEPVNFVFPPMPHAVVMHDKLGPLFDRLSMQFYASKCMTLAAPPAQTQVALTEWERKCLTFAGQHLLSDGFTKEADALLNLCSQPTTGANHD